MGIQIEHLHKSFHNQVSLCDVSLSFETGKIHGVIGRNGSGKSVLFKCICGLISCDSGTIKIDDELISPENPPISKIGALIETPGFLTNLNAYENLKFLCTLSHTSYDKIPETLELVGLEQTKKSVGKYSMGMRQKLGIVQAIIDDRPIIILDEPMNSLDDESVQRVRELLLNMKRSGKTIIIASHVKEDIACLCDTVTTLQHGKVI